MSVTTRLGLGIIVVAAALGVLGDALLRVAPWGLNVAVLAAALVALTAALVRWRAVPVGGAGRWLALPALGFAAAYAWRDSATLGALNLLALAAALGLAAWRTRAGSLRLAGLTDYALGLCLAALHAGAGILALLVNDIRWAELPRRGWSRGATAAGVGLVLACPPLVIFGGLFAAADPVFENLAVNILRLDLAEIVTHLLLIAVGAWLAGGLLRQALLGPIEEPPPGERPAFLRLGTVEVGVALGLLDALFLAFVAIQFRYFFGGAALVEVSPALTYAEYARRGFFELVTVAALALPLLLLADWLHRPAGAGGRRLVRALAGAMVAMLVVILASAVGRMRLYQEEFGLTELRLYTTAFMGWLAVVLLWFVATVLRGRRERFAFGGLVAAVAVVALLNALNPDALIVRVNVARLAAGQRFDAAYVAGLSADAVPALVEALPALPPAERGRVEADLRRRWSPPAAVDWRTLNWGRAQAWLAIDRERTASGRPLGGEAVAGGQVGHLVTSYDMVPASRSVSSPGGEALAGPEANRLGTG